MDINQEKKEGNINEKSGKAQESSVRAISQGLFTSRTKRKRCSPVSNANFPGLTPLQLENLKRLKKNEREKQRRHEVNVELYKLADLLGIPRGEGIEKVMILRLAVETLKTLQSSSKSR